MNHRWKINSDFRQPLMTSLLLVTLGCTLWAGFSLVKAYQTSLTWTPHQDPTTQAELPPDALGDSNPLSKQAKEDFMNQVDSFYNATSKDFTRTVTDKDLDRLRDTFEAIDPLDRPRYQDRFVELQSKLQVQLAYNALFQDENYTIFKNTITPKDILKVNQETFDYIKALYTYSKGQDGFANRIYQLQQTLNQEAERFDDLMTTLMATQVAPPLGTTLFTRQDAYPESLEPFYSQLTSLQYKWPVLNQAVEIADSVKGITQGNQARYDRYKDFLDDIATRDKAYKELDDRVLALNDQVLKRRKLSKEDQEQKHQEAKEQRAKEQREDITPPKVESQDVPDTSRLQEVVEALEEVETPVLEEDPADPSARVLPEE